MVLFDNMTTVAIYTTLTVIVLLWYGARTNPFRIGGLFVKELTTSRSFLLHFAGLLAILFCNKIELKIENAYIDNSVNFAGLFQSIEGNFVSNLQHTFENPILTTVLSFIYVVVFQSLMITSIGIYTYQDKTKRMFYAICYAIMINYFIAIPFFLFFPVDEVWYHDPTVRFLMLDVFPNFETEYRALSGLNNCFPSLHTSISVTIAVLAIRSGNKRWAWFCSIICLCVLFSIFYLGIHWLIDMCGGLVLGLFASTVGLKLSSTTIRFRTKRRAIVATSPSSRSLVHEEAN
ncbi:membrane-associated phospholipid phosphatase [Paenibacillus phyllosphaerae]|uniref:Membrane-associated phospholipid phosphatase n=1 Tax=Paenibacillus phyllosphaerae TaxID=274593 RepID=A0A7W5AWF6_9BACL|nr:phosphatase PAP2 family protein [Paenibacillus phyllosphaerae]MBB3109927.1 membrane-associated phospholipid phosphatase [Paenibacillus phyllosphaerae]